MDKNITMDLKSYFLLNKKYEVILLPHIILATIISTFQMSWNIILATKLEMK